MDSNARLRIATRIHFALLRQYGEDVGVSSLLAGEGEAREALWVCEASGNEELVALAQQFNVPAANASNAGSGSTSSEAIKPAIAAAATRPAPLGSTKQELAWSRDTSGFGLSRLSEFGTNSIDPNPARNSGWMSATGWLRRGATR